MPATQQLIMKPSALSSPPRFASWADSWLAIVALVAVVTAARVAYLIWACPYTLVEDEAHYWEWSRRPDWSYYSKGPGIAWSIAATTGLLGTSEWTVRLGAPLFGAVTALAIAGLAADATRDRRSGFFAAACVLLTPLFQITSLLMTIDMPYVAMWSVACWAGWRAMERSSRSAWLSLGAAVGIGFLFKYTMALVLPGLIGYALVRRRRLSLASGWQVAAIGAAAIAALGAVPVLVWNSQHGWPTVAHLLGHLDLPGGDMPQQASQPWRYQPRWTLTFLGTQLLVMGPALVLAAYSLGAMLRRPASLGDGRSAPAYLLCAAGPVLLFYLGVSVMGETEGNWAMAGYVTPLAAAGWGVVDGCSRLRARVAQWRALPAASRPRSGIFRRRPEGHRQIAWHATVVVGLIVGLGSLRLDWLDAAVRSAAAAVHRDVSLPIGRLLNADVMADDVARLLDGLRSRARAEPFVIAQHYGRASLLAFYLPGRPTVYCASSRMGGRATQYDYWPDTSLDNLAVLRDRPAVLVGATLEQWQPAFSRVELWGTLRGEHKKGRLTFLGFRFRGFRDRPDIPPAPTR